MDMLSKKKSVSQDATFSIPSKDKDYEEITYYDFDDSTTGTFKDDSENINKENVNDQDENVYSELEKYWGFVEEPNEEEKELSEKPHVCLEVMELHVKNRYDEDLVSELADGLRENLLKSGLLATIDLSAKYDILFHISCGKLMAFISPYKGVTLYGYFDS
ncbi:hypothetical protein Csa_012198 [Cucumis sativus]|uniref:Uncharacterized protein n=1 Tax=Cucumis sativus TaxID=3659 RepID=A0A0A0L2P5_CUCSA|nr:hypothetical protein Csa_012198 [Cucumis sativus]